MKDQIRLVALDIDGTLINDDLEISENTKRQIHKLYNDGVHIVLSTGRTFISAKNIMRKLSLDIPIVSYNGGNVYIPEIGHISKEKMSIDNAKIIINYGEKNNLYVKVYIDDVLYVKEHDPLTIEFSKDHGIEYKAVGKLSDKIVDDVNMIVFYHHGIPNEDRKKLEKLNVTITSSNPSSLEFNPIGITKAKGLQLILEHLNLEKEEVLAIGDGLNDLEMLKFAGKGIVMKNADPILLNQWDNISDYNNNEDGVYHILKELNKYE